MSWKGIYSNFANVPKKGPGFDGEKWLKTSRREAYRLLAAVNEKEYGQIELTDSLILLIQTVALLLGEKKRVRVLDFGGGLGFSYLPLKLFLPEFERVDYCIVDRLATCEEGERLFTNEKHLCFIENIPEYEMEFDLVLVSSALQYVENYKGLLWLLAKCSRKFILLTKFSGMLATTFATGQTNVPGSVIPYWFINIDEAENILDQNGFKLLARYPGNIQGVPSRDTWNLLFGREPIDGAEGKEKEEIMLCRKHKTPLSMDGGCPYCHAGME